jgi:hypothetical protein
MQTMVTLTLREWQDVADRLSRADAARTAERGLPARIAATVAALRPHGYETAGLGLATHDAQLVQAVRRQLVDQVRAA